MFKKSVILILIFAFLFTACAAAEPENQESNQETIQETYEIPVVENIAEYTELSPSEQSIYKNYLSTLSEDLIADSLKNHIDEFDIDNEMFSLKSVVAKKDDLSLIEEENKKPYSNVDFTIEILMAENDEIFKKDLASDYIEEFRIQLSQNIIYALKSKNVIIRVVDENENIIDEKESEITRLNTEDNYFLQNTLEEQAQTVAFNYGEFSNRQFFLEKFGIKEGTNELFVEYFVDNGYFETDDANKELEDFNELVKTYLLDMEHVEYFMSAEKLDKITISSYSRPDTVYEKVETTFEIN